MNPSVPDDGGVPGSVTRTWGYQVLAVWCLLSLPACAGPLTQWGEETSLVWKAAAFEPAEVERERVAVLQAMVGFGLEGYAHQVSRTLAQALLGGEHTVAVMFPSQALSRINREGLAADYAGMVSEYARSGILRREGLGKIGQALGVSYVFQPSMASFSQTISGRFSFFGLRLFQTRVTQLRLSVQLWDTRTGEIVWEASGEATLAAEDVREFRIPFEEIAGHLWRRILHELWS